MIHIERKEFYIKPFSIQKSETIDGRWNSLLYDCKTSKSKAYT